MSNYLLLHNKSAVKVNAKHVMWGVTEKACMYSINGDIRWVPKKHSKFTLHKEQKFSGHDYGELIIEEWLYNRLFPNENKIEINEKEKES